ncbi:hypothetical protein B5S28_g2789 [[Candida] boidinii]|nr:hypothetical protein B5S28_g2789 [[Candida] boidinii]OWB60218.1 hypothetical protein B5S29_g1089 [[Candida] boidinii]OWB71141.1 hypothetical protein B5S31_g825 [[Candida] boidinii]
MSNARYEYDENAETWPYFVLTGLIVPLIPTTIQFAYKKLSQKTEENKEKDLLKSFKPYNKEQLDEYKIKKSRKSFFTPQVLFMIIGWIIVFYMIYKINNITISEAQAFFDPWKILGIDETATEREVKSAFRKMSLIFHPDKMKKDGMTEAEVTEIEEKYVIINKAYKSLTDEATKENFLKYGNPDGPSDVKHGIAIPKFLIEGAASPLLVVLYIVLIGFILPYFVNSWWTGIKSYTKKGLHVDTATKYFQFMINFNPAKIVNIETILQWISESTEFKLLNSSLTPKRVHKLLLSQINRTKLSAEDEKLKMDVVAIAPKLILGLIDIASGFRYTDICFTATDAHRAIIQAINPAKSSTVNKFAPILQLPGVELEKLDTQQPIHTLGKLLKKPTVPAEKFLNVKNSEDILKLAAEIPSLELISSNFKVPGEDFIPPTSSAHVALKYFFKSPSQKSVPEIKKLSKDVSENQLNEVETMETLRNPFKIVQDQPSLPTPIAPYFPDEEYLSTTGKGWIAFLIVQRDGKLAEAPQYLTQGDLSNLKLTQEEFLESKANVSTYKLPISAPTPNEVGVFPFRVVLKSLSYFGNDLDVTVNMKVENAPEEEKKDHYEIEDPDEDSIAGAMAQMRGQKVKKIAEDNESSDDSSDDDSDDEEEEYSDLDTDTEVEEDAIEEEK